MTLLNEALQQAAERGGDTQTVRTRFYKPRFALTQEPQTNHPKQIKMQMEFVITC